mgnify:CR=1 FL=1
MSLKNKVELIELVQKILDEDPSDFSIAVNDKRYKLTINYPNSWSNSWASSSDIQFTIAIPDVES